jgi:hypothetical protein
MRLTPGAWLKLRRSGTRLGSASVKGDTAAIGAILADDFTDVSLTGEVVSKVQVLADLKAENTE